MKSKHDARGIFAHLEKETVGIFGTVDQMKGVRRKPKNRSGPFLSERLLHYFWIRGPL